MVTTLIKKKKNVSHNLAENLMIAVHVSTFEEKLCQDDTLIQIICLLLMQYCHRDNFLLCGCVE